jgi:hypothetical protein
MVAKLQEREMLKFAKIAKVGQVIRAYDFKPMVGRADCYVEGTVIKIDNRGYDCFVITVTRDVFDGEVQPRGEHSRVGHEVYVPFQVSFMEYDARVMNLSE